MKIKELAKITDIKKQACQKSNRVFTLVSMSTVEVSLPTYFKCGFPSSKLGKELLKEFTIYCDMTFNVDLMYYDHE